MLLCSGKSWSGKACLGRSIRCGCRLGQGSFRIRALLHDHHLLRQVLTFGILLEDFQANSHTYSNLYPRRYCELLGDRCCKPTSCLPIIVVSTNGFKFFVSIFQCIPVSGFWDRFLATPDAPKCGVEVTKFFEANSIPNIITDVAILILPIPYIWKLHLPTKQKLGLITIFILGAL